MTDRQRAAFELLGLRPDEADRLTAAGLQLVIDDTAQQLARERVTIYRRRLQAELDALQELRPLAR